MKKYYYAGATRLAMRIGSGTGTSGLQWLLGDHLGSTSVVAEGSSGARVSELRYKPWGELRYAYQVTPSDRRYTGQVNFTYHPQMLLKTAFGSTTYLKGADYDPAGRADLFKLVLFTRPNSNLESMFGAQAQPDPILELQARLIYGGIPIKAINIIDQAP